MENWWILAGGIFFAFLAYISPPFTGRMLAPRSTATLAIGMVFVLVGFLALVFGQGIDSFVYCLISAGFQFYFHKKYAKEDR